MSLPPLAGGDHTILSSEFCSGYMDISGVWNNGFYCPQTGSTLAVFCCGTPTFKYCCTTKPINGTGSGIVDDFIFGRMGGDGGNNIGKPIGAISENNGGDTVTIDGSGVGAGGNDYSGATRMRPASDENLNNLNSNDLTTLNLSDVPIIFGVACGVAAVLILVILVGFYLVGCCTHYHQLAQNRKRRSSMTGIYRGVTTANTSTNSGLVNLYSPTHSAGTTGGGGTPGSLPGSLVGGAGLLSATTDNTQTYIVHHHHHNNPPASPDSCSTSADHFQMNMGGGGSASLVTTPLDIEWSSTAQYHQKPQQVVLPTSASSQLQQQPLNLLSNHIVTDNRIHYTVHQTQNRLAVALTGSMNRLSDRASPCPNPASSSYPVNIPLTPPDSYSYPRPISRGLSPPPQYSSSFLGRAESPPYYPSYDNGNSNGGGGGSLDNPDSLHNQHHHNYLSRTSTLPLSLARKPPSGANRPLLTSPGPYSNVPAPQPKSILRTSQNYRRVVTNETPPPIPPHNSNSAMLYVGGPITYTSSGSMEGANGGGGGGGSSGSIAYRNVDSRTNLSSQPLLLLESKVDNSRNGSEDLTSLEGADDEDESGLHTATVIRRASISKGVNASSVEEEEEEEEEEERRDHFDIHDIDSDALSRLIELDLDSKL